MSGKVRPMDMFWNTGLFGSRTGYNNSPAANRENAVQSNIQRNICELAVNRFIWKGLPDGIDPRFLEMTLLMNGLSVFYWDRDFNKLLAVKGSPTGYVNFMDWPIAYTIIGPGSKINGVAGSTMLSKQITGFIPFTKPPAGKDEKDLAYPVWCNAFRQSEFDTIMIYAGRLATTDITLEVNTANARQNKVVTSTSNNQLSMVNMVRQMDEGVKVIQPKDAGMMDNISVIDLGVDAQMFGSLRQQRNAWWNECMTILGIDSANQDKKERLVEAEVGANDDQADTFRFVALNARRDGIKHINDAFGTNITVDYNTEVEAMAKAMAATNGTDGDKPEKPKSDDKDAA